MEGLLILFEIIIVNLLLSADNAIIIAMVSAQLPESKRKTVILIGTLLAVVLRCILVLFALPLLKIPYLQAVGGIFLFVIAIKLLHDQQHDAPTSANKPVLLSLRAGIWTIVTADFVMSLDNVLALAAIAHGDFILIMLGIAISIPMIIWGSKLVLSLIQKFSFISYIGAALLAFAAGEMLVKDDGLQPLILRLSPDLLTYIPLILIPLVVIFGIMKKKTV